MNRYELFLTYGSSKGVSIGTIQSIHIIGVTDVLEMKVAGKLKDLVVLERRFVVGSEFRVRNIELILREIREVRT